MFLQMLKDEHPEVRLHIISKLDIVNKGKAQSRRKRVLEN
jgi:serine/threonine-protein phosphatase 2A regulatory subunit A